MAAARKPLRRLCAGKAADDPAADKQRRQEPIDEAGQGVIEGGGQAEGGYRDKAGAAKTGCKY